MGTLYIVATPIGNLADMTPRAIDVLRSVALIAAEDTRHSANLLRTFGIRTPTMSYHEHNRASRSGRLMAALSDGDVALISDAGTPAIADPGHALVVEAIAAGHKVVPIPGPSSLVAAISASGLAPGPFMFVGFLPRSGEERRLVLGKAIATGFPFVVFESPLRANRTLCEIDAAAPGRSGVVARELSKLHEEFRRGTIPELVALYADQPPRGEVTIVVGEGPQASTSVDGNEIEALAESILQQGVKPSKAARELSSITGITAAEAYELTQRLSRTESDR
ncbi:16S rRNA (cytidine(1402)-2'-O)-methyltransferase [soil metagenome]